MNRTPNADVRRILRKEVGFGCPVPGCSNPYLEWHHFQPPWNVQQHHNPEGMVALCSEHHKKADAGAYSNEQLREFKQGANQHTTEIQGKFEWLRKSLLAIVGGNFYYETLIIFEFKKKPIIWFRRNEDGYLLLNISMLTTTNEERTIIEDNDWVKKGHPVDLQSPPSGKLLRVDYENGDHVKIEFFELESLEDLKKHYQNISPERWEIQFPITAVEITYRIGGTKISFDPKKTSFDSFIMHGSFMNHCRCGIAIA